MLLAWNLGMEYDMHKKFQKKKNYGFHLHVCWFKLPTCQVTKVYLTQIRLMAGFTMKSFSASPEVSLNMMQHRKAFSSSHFEEEYKRHGARYFHRWKSFGRFVCKCRLSSRKRTIVDVFLIGHWNFRVFQV